MENTEQLDGVEVLPFADEQAFTGWLSVHHTRYEGVWLKLARKASGIPSLTSDQAVDVGLCYGWISGQRRGLDERYYLQKYVPRRPGSLWSQVNVEKVAVLTAEGRMREPGFAEVRRAQADGRWARAYRSQRNATVPEDLAAALAADPAADRAFQALDRTGRYLTALPLLQTPTPQVRQTRLERTVRRLAEEGRSGGEDTTVDATT
ncbi:YdeI/OmpD-associated family protein [Kitasatospora sp. NBC_00240]|uniref:YdeI/OmpD-associated family protein n=1 Tax=Kitasatospora sp. NBC_00240 TaxID=2903567 RepID=UPI002250B775|nr:YdeI/OmpD-associated family protein [Kitasatospora sp. NBC_00240]MCX5214316.1 YdeI/OmpD-associated family protein [Kitasatospora sp. NBC_00240]